MATIDLVEQLRNRANVSYHDAKDALDACDNDILEALIYLERLGKVAPPTQGGTYSTPRSHTYQAPPPSPEPVPDKESVGSIIRDLFIWLGGWIRKGNRNYFIAFRNGEYVFSLPITLMVVLFFLTFWFSGVILLISLFMGFRYSFEGYDINPESFQNLKQRK